MIALVAAALQYAEKLNANELGAGEYVGKKCCTCVNILYAAHLLQHKVVMLTLQWGITPLWVLHSLLQWMHFPYNALRG